VYVLGEVLRPGRFEFRTGERVIHALADGGGLTGKARETGVILLRREGDGKDHVYRLDFEGLHARMVPQDIYLQPGDVVFVPKSRYGTVQEFASGFLDVVSRAATTAVSVEVLRSRTQALTVAR
jgi:protein involved in polysaccharide export with SLBB domain